MKKRFIYSVPFVFILLFFVVISTSCLKEKKCKVIVTVKYWGNGKSDTLKLVTGAKVKMYSKKGDASVLAEGYTNDVGQFEHEYKLEAILDIVATKDTTPNTTLDPLLMGSVAAKLKAGFTINRTIFLML